MLGPREQLVIKISAMVLSAMIPELQKKAAETKSPVDDLLVQIAQAIIEVVRSGELDVIL